jgi:hypothetical protein
MDAPKVGDFELVAVTNEVLGLLRSEAAARVLLHLVREAEWFHPAKVPLVGHALAREYLGRLVTLGLAEYLFDSHQRVFRGTDRGRKLASAVIDTAAAVVLAGDEDWSDLSAAT